MSEAAPFTLAWRRFARDPWAVAGLAVLVAIAFAAIAAPWIVDHALHQSPFRLGILARIGAKGGEVDVVSALGLPLGPCARFPLGADLLGRDVLSRLLYGARISLLVSSLGTLLALGVGLAAGLLAGFYRGAVDLVVSRFVDAMMAIPVLLLAIALASVLRQGSVWMMILILAIVNWTYLARIIRAEVLSLRERDFIEAARALGVSDAMVLWRHLVPNLLGPLTVFATLSMAGNILLESALSYLGVGIQPPVPSWGNMIQEGVPFYAVAWWITLFPGIALLITVLCLNLVGDGMRRAVAPGPEGGGAIVTAMVVRRLFWSLVVLVVVSAVTFAIFFAVPGDPARLIAGKYANAETVALIQKKLGLDRPKLVQLGYFLVNAARGDWGYSYVSQQPVLPTILTAFPKTLSLSVGAVLVWLSIGIPFGIVSALKPRSIWDRLATFAALIGVSAPVYWLGLVLLRVFADALGWFPLGDYATVADAGLFEWARHLVLPWFTLAVLYAGWYARFTRSQMIDVMRLDYVRTAWAKGLGPRAVIGRHVLRNALLPLVTMLGIDFAYLLGGAVLTESVFGIPGIGGLAWRSIRQRDLPMVMGTVLFAAVFIVLANLAVDLFYMVLDPRIRAEE